MIEFRDHLCNIVTIWVQSISFITTRRVAPLWVGSFIATVDCLFRFLFIIIVVIDTQHRRMTAVYNIIRIESKKEPRVTARWRHSPRSESARNGPYQVHCLPDRCTQNERAVAPPVLTDSDQLTTGPNSAKCVSHVTDSLRVSGRVGCSGAKYGSSTGPSSELETQ